MARKKVGLSLGAGSAKGFAHLGVIKVFEQYGIPIDFVSGSSMGAVVGGIYSVGTDVELITKLIPTLNERSLFDVTIPNQGGFLKGNKFQELVQLFTKNKKFSETKIPFSCVAVDLFEGEVVNFNDPDMRIEDAIRASFAIPVIIKPHQLGDKVYVDGGVLCRVPNQQVREMGADVVIAVDVGYRGGQIRRTPANIADYAFSAFDIMMWHISKENDVNADCLIIPDVLQYDSNSLKDFEAIVQEGEKAALEMLPVIQELLG